MPSRRFESLLFRLQGCGYPPRYLQRLEAELCDHFECLFESHLRNGLSVSDAEDRAAAGLGDDEALFHEVITRHPPPFVCRHPALAFTVGPISAVALCVGAFVLVGGCIYLSATRLFGIVPTEPTFRWLVLSGFQVFATALTPLLAFFFCRSAARHGLPLWLALVACLILAAAGGFFLTDLVLCPASGSLKYFHRIGLNRPRLVLVAVVFVLHTLWRFLRRRRGLAAD